MVDNDLAELYGVATKALNQAIQRNRSRFPKDFMFRLTAKEAAILRSQIVTSSHGGRRYVPYVFTEQGVAMLSSVLHSSRAIKVNIAIMRAFVRLREVLAANTDLAAEIERLRNDQQEHGQQIRQIFSIIESLMEPPADPPKRRIGFAGAD